MNTKSRRQWTLEKCQENALQYSTKTEWNKASTGAYQAASRNGWRDKCCQHMTVNKCSVHWTLEKCQENALQHSTKTEWNKASTGAYQAASRNGWLDKCCQHMVVKNKSNAYWTLEKCQEDALQYSTKTEWNKASTGAYQAAYKNGWLDKCCQHMTVNKCSVHWTLDKCMVEALKFSSKSEWKNSKVGGYYTALKNGWISQCCAHMNSTRKWNHDNCKEEALKFTSKSQWMLNSKGSYNYALRHGLVEKLSKHMQKLEKWSLEKCMSSSSNYTSKIDWRRGDRNAYEAAKRNGWFAKCCEHMPSNRKLKRSAKTSWTLELCKESAARYKSRQDWMHSEQNAYLAARRKGWSEECTQHMESGKSLWDLDKCLSIARRHTSTSQWRANCSRSYGAALRHGWLDECRQHMVEQKRPSGYWTLEKCKEDALKYSTRSSWYEGKGGGYYAAQRRGWLDQCCAHMKK